MIIEYIKEYANNKPRQRSKVSKALGNKLIKLGVAKEYTPLQPIPVKVKVEPVNKAVKKTSNKAVKMTKAKTRKRK